MLKPSGRLTLPSLLLACCFAAEAKEAPEHIVFPQLNALSATYHVESTAVRSNLYVTNFESFNILCDASMNTNKQDKQKKQETTIEPQKTIKFTFTHRAFIERIELYLVCAAPEGVKSSIADDSTSGSVSAGKPAAPETRPTPVIVEELTP